MWESRRSLEEEKISAVGGEEGGEGYKQNEITCRYCVCVCVCACHNQYCDPLSQSESIRVVLMGLNSVLMKLI